MADINVTVEPPLENQIVEVTYDGQEIIQPPLTQAENLMRQTAKLDFSSIPDDLDDDEDNIEDTSDGKESESTQDNNKWPWESVRDHLRDALAEVSVLSDVLTIATKECGRDHAGQPKRYMVLDGPSSFEPQPEQRPYVTLIAKRKALNEQVSKILTTGAEHLKSLQSENRTSVSDSNNRNNANFHFELLRLRQNWRLKKVSNTILGDLSFRTAGSQYKQSGIFEVLKSDEKSDSDTSSTQPANSSATSSGDPPKSVLKVTVPTELEGIAFIQVVIQKESEQLVSANICQNGTFDPSLVEDVHWQKKLEQAQNVIFCKELFAQLAREAIEVQAPVPHMVVGNQISCSLLPDVQLLITLWYKSGKEGKRHALGSMNGQNGHEGETPTPPQPAKDHSHVLEHSLHQLLRKAHRRNLNPETGGLSSSPVGVSKRRRIAGPRAADRKTLLKMATEETFLEQIIAQAQHVVLRLRAMFVLDQVSQNLRDPLITFHWSTLSSPTRTSVKVSIITSGYDTIQRTQLVIHIYTKKLTFVCKDGRVLHFSHEPQELRDFILCQISQHQINSVQALAKCTGWQVLSSSTYHLGCGPVEPLGNATGCLLANCVGDKFIAVRHSPQSGQASVYVANSPKKDFYTTSVIKDAKWSNLPDSFQQVNIEKMDGKNLLNKIELLMAALTPLNKE